MSKATEAAEIENFLEAEIDRNIHQIKRNEVGSSRRENATSEKSADDLGRLFRRITDCSTHEIENLIDNCTACA